MFAFSLFALVFLAAILFICITILVIINNRTRDKINSHRKSRSWKYSMIYIYIGILIIILSALSFISILMDYLGDHRIFQTVYLMTSEPIRVVSLAGVLVGITVLIVGIFYRRAFISLHSTWQSVSSVGLSRILQLASSLLPLNPKSVNFMEKKE